MISEALRQQRKRGEPGLGPGQEKTRGLDNEIISDLPHTWKGRICLGDKQQQRPIQRRCCAWFAGLNENRAAVIKIRHSLAAITGRNETSGLSL